MTADDNGSWEISSPRRMFEVQRSEATGVVLSISKSESQGDDVYTLIRQYGTHKATKKEKGVEFKRVITTLKDPHGQWAPLAILQYYFKGGKEEDIVLAPHRNARGKSKRPYLRTSASALQSLKEHCFEKKPKVIYDNGFHQSGGLLKSNSISDEPRNPKQIYNARTSQVSKNDTDKDEIFQLLMKLKDDNTADGGFIQNVKFGNTPEVILGFEQQMTDIVRFCTNPLRFSVMGIDPTFNLGKFFVTLTTYKHPMLVLKESQRNPVFIGPAFIHLEQTTQSYYSFLSHLTGQKPSLKELQAYGSDGEVALINALLAVFGENTIGLRCFIHMKNNLEDALLKKFMVKPEVKSTVIHDIFGYKLGDTKVR